MSLEACSPVGMFRAQRLLLPMFPVGIWWASAAILGWGSFPFLLLTPVFIVGTVALVATSLRTQYPDAVRVTGDGEAFEFVRKGHPERIDRQAIQTPVRIADVYGRPVIYFCVRDAVARRRTRWYYLVVDDRQLAAAWLRDVALQ